MSGALGLCSHSQLQASAAPFSALPGVHGLRLTAAHFAATAPSALRYEWRYRHAGVELPLAEPSPLPTLSVRTTPRNGNMRSVWSPPCLYRQLNPLELLAGDDLKPDLEIG